MSEPKRKRANRRSDTFAKPVFGGEESPPMDEPFFAAEELPPAQTEFDEPIFDAVPAQARGVTLPVDAPRVDMGWETLGSDTFDESDAPASSDTDRPSSARRLGRTGPVWVGLSAVALLLVATVWLFLRNSTPDEPVLATFPVAGVVGSAQMADTETAPPASEPTPAPADTPPSARFVPGAEVVVGNTNGQGIRLRATPGTNSLTLGIYNDGAPFLVLTPGGDYGDYPVEANGYFWYRIRVLQDPADQLVGWVVGDFLVSQER